MHIKRDFIFQPIERPTAESSAPAIMVMVTDAGDRSRWRIPLRLIGGLVTFTITLHLLLRGRKQSPFRIDGRGKRYVSYTLESAL
jgi:hypothetical protein